MAFWSKILGWFRRDRRDEETSRPDRAELLERRRARQEAIDAVRAAEEQPEDRSSFPTFRSSAVDRNGVRGNLPDWPRPG